MEEPEGQKSFAADRRLEYRSAEADRVPVKAGQVICGIIITMVLVMGSVFLGIMASAGIQLFVFLGPIVLLCNWWAYVAYRDPGYRSFGIGMWIGFGVAVLIEGACFELTIR